ncbi:DUF1232 domain-containing protein [Coriobacteriales bacterium OH1046]|nr:DUF1232 domain-containing protein [Coriobacteriales bacterium OH1046]
MTEQLDLDSAKQLIDDGLEEARSFLSDPEKIDGLLDSLKAQMAELPETVTGALSNVPLMASMVKSYVTKEYTEVSPKVVASLVAAFLYLVKRRDLISDNIPLLGLADDLAVVTIALKINEPELEAFKNWQARKSAGDGIL